MLKAFLELPFFERSTQERLEVIKSLEKELFDKIGEFDGSEKKKKEIEALQLIYCQIGL